MNFVEVLQSGYVKGNSQKGDILNVSHLSEAEIDALVKAKVAKRIEVASGDMAELEKENAELKAKLEKLPKGAKEAEKQLGDLEAKVKTLEKENAELKAKIPKEA